VLLKNALASLNPLVTHIEDSLLHALVCKASKSQCSCAKELCVVLEAAARPNKATQQWRLRQQAGNQMCAGSPTLQRQPRRVLVALSLVE